MMPPANYQIYTERPAANCNILPRDYDDDKREITRQRNIGLELLDDSRISQEQRDFLEMYVARANRWLKRTAAHWRDTRLARLRLLREFS